MRTTRLALALVLAVACGAAACGKKQDGGTPPEPAAPPTTEPTPAVAGEIDACALLAPADIQAVTGMAVAASGHGAGAAGNVCEIDLGESNQLMLTAYASSAKETFEAGPGNPIDGLGDQAKWEPSARMLSVLVGDKAFTVTLLVFTTELPEAQQLEQTRKLASKILEKL